LSDTESDDDDEEEEEEQGRAVDWEETLEGYRKRPEPRRSIRSTYYTATTHHQGRARIDFDNDDDDGDAGTVAGTSGAGGGKDVDWDDVQRDEE
jgi:hypothetical protein